MDKICSNFQINWDGTNNFETDGYFNYIWYTDSEECDAYRLFYQLYLLLIWLYIGELVIGAATLQAGIGKFFNSIRWIIFFI